MTYPKTCVRAKPHGLRLGEKAREGKKNKISAEL